MEDIEPNNLLIILEGETTKILSLKNSIKTLDLLSLKPQSILAILGLKIEGFEKWKIRLSTKENIIQKLARDTDEDFKFGLMDQGMKGFGCMIKLMGKED